MLARYWQYFVYLLACALGYLLNIFEFIFDQASMRIVHWDASCSKETFSNPSRVKMHITVIFNTWSYEFQVHIGHVNPVKWLEGSV